MSDGLRRDTAAVSSVVGTVLMLAITVSVFSGLSLVILDSVASEPDAPHADLRIFEGNGTILVQHRRGESLDVDEGRFLLNIDGTHEELPLSSQQGTLGATWDLGESVCLSCLYPGQEVRGVALVYGQFLLLSEGERGAAP